MYSRTETITPEIAVEYLKHNKENRKFRPGVAKRYADDMKFGKWQLTPQGISFYENGDLADGQHRLSAIVDSGCTVDMQVTYGVPMECTIQDRGAKRSTGDILHMNGIKSGASTTNGISAVNYLFIAAGNHGLVSDSTIDEFIRDGNNEQLLCDALSICNCKTNKLQLMRKAPIIAAVFCALYCGVPKDGLYKFAEIVNTGFCNNANEQSAIVLRNYMIQDFSNRNTAERRFAFVVTTNAIRDFASQTPRQKIYKSNADPAFLKYVKKNALAKYMTK